MKFRSRPPKANSFQSNTFTDFSLTSPGTTTEFTPDGKVKFEFPATDNAAFFRIEAE